MRPIHFFNRVEQLRKVLKQPGIRPLQMQWQKPRKSGPERGAFWRQGIRRGSGRLPVVNRMNGLINREIERADIRRAWRETMATQGIPRKEQRRLFYKLEGRELHFGPRLRFLQDK